MASGLKQGGWVGGCCINPGNGGAWDLRGGGGQTVDSGWTLKAELTF